jgi:hypothetical protein
MNNVCTNGVECTMSLCLVVHCTLLVVGWLDPRAGLDIV